ncbi:MAG: oligosaccharide flippase family protein [Flammeovirgaceae bacterium]|jgi:O-antigen/teichoic acid export membrane protein|nr:oligosaccharide flippase family protein [Flammeovirgaceae bacterium]
MLAELRLNISTFIKSRSLSNAAWSSAEAVIYPLLMIVATPIFIQKLGVELYGIWMLVNSITATIGVLNVGLGDATIKFVSKYLALGDRKGLVKIIGASYSIYLALCFVAISVSLVISFLIKNYDLFGIPKAHRLTIFFTIQIASITLGLKFIEQIFLAVFKGFERYDLAAKISIIGKISIIIVNILLAYLGYSLIIIFVSTCIVSFIYLVVEARLVYNFSGFNKFIPSYEKVYIKEIASFGVWTWALSVLSILTGQIDKFLVVSLSDIKTFAYYSVALTIFTQIHNFFSASISWIFPIVSRKIHQNERIDVFYFEVQFFFIASVTFSLIVFYFIKTPLISFWLGPIIFGKVNHFIDAFVVLNFIMACTIAPYYFLNGSGNFKLNTIFNVITFAARLLLIPLSYHLLGQIGLVVGLIVSSLLVIPFQIHQFYKRAIDHNDRFSGLKSLIPTVIFSALFVFENVFIGLAVFCGVLFTLFYIYPYRRGKTANP